MQRKIHDNAYSREAKDGHLGGYFTMSSMIFSNRGKNKIIFSQ